VSHQDTNSDAKISVKDAVATEGIGLFIMHTDGLGSVDGFDECCVGKDEYLVALTLDEVTELIREKGYDLSFTMKPGKKHPYINVTFR
jgi:hypothetical protein